MTKSVVWTVLFSVIAGILQSAVLGRIPIFKVIPDLALCVIVFSAYVNGTMPGQIGGFFSGLLLDFLSYAPLGLNCLTRTIIGALAGIFKGALFLDIIFMPAILCALATIIKALIVLLLHLLIGPAIPLVYLITPSVFLIELGLNAVCAPLIFLLLRNFKPIIVGRG